MHDTELENDAGHCRSFPQGALTDTSRPTSKKLGRFEVRQNHPLQPVCVIRVGKGGRATRC